LIPRRCSWYEAGISTGTVSTPHGTHTLENHLALARSPIVIFLSKTNMEQSVANMARYELSGGHIATHIGTNTALFRKYGTLTGRPLFNSKYICSSALSTTSPSSGPSLQVCRILSSTVNDLNEAIWPSGSHCEPFTGLDIASAWKSGPVWSFVQI
jgi:hypothetical protein